MLYALDQHTVRINGEVFIADNATLIGQVELDAGASVWFNAVIRADNDTIHIGANTNVQDGAVIHTDPGLPMRIGANVTIGHRAVLHGCRIGPQSLIGINAVILNSATIGACCLVGANSLVTEGKQFPDRCLLMGSPAQVVRELSDDEVTGLQQSADIYRDKIRRYLQTLRRMPT